MEQKKCGCGAAERDAGASRDAFPRGSVGMMVRTECGEGSCSGCPGEEVFGFWCGSCQRSVPEKRCPYCGLKARKKRQDDAG